MDFDAKEATVVFDPAQTTPDSLVAAVVNAGFKASVKQSAAPVKEEG